ncbi:MAG: glycosyltransferase family 2 protein [Gammaproteobacteria bacterium]|nr:glycosyltransferase family 2 protein [Gammaproteobacteria bacterium]
MKLSVVIPCYNEEQVLEALFERMTAAARAWNLDYEVICVDDGSSDRTWALLRAQHARDARWRCLSLARNFGHQAAVSAGMYHACGDALVVIDADLQDPPEEISRMLEKWREGYQVVFAIRASRADPPLKSLLAWAFYRTIAKLVSFRIPVDAGDFCLLDRRVVNVMNAMPERGKYLRGLRAWSGFRQIGLPFQRHARAAGEAHYTFKKSLRLALDGVVSFSSMPLRIASILGWWVSVFALVGILFVLAQRIFSDWFESMGLGPAPGFATIVISILFLGGVQLICLGIIGEYLARIYEEVKGRPQWIIGDSIGFDHAPSPPKSPLLAP